MNKDSKRRKYGNVSKDIEILKNRLEIELINTKLKNIFEEQEFEYRIVFQGNTTKYKDVRIQNNLEFLDEIMETEVKYEPIIRWWN